MKFFIRSLFVCFFLINIIPVSRLSAQTYEIKAVNNGSGQISVQVRQTASGQSPTTASLLSDFTFGVYWLQSCGNTNITVVSSGYGIIKTGARLSKSYIGNSYYTQAFALSAIINFPTDWTTNSWYEIVVISNGSGTMGVCDFSICPNGFDSTTDPNIGVDALDYTPVITANAINVTLPVALTAFSAQAIGAQIRLDWTTESEKNMRHYDVERSNDGQKFTLIAAEKALNKDFASYSAFDRTPQYNGIIYYRLKAIDQNGKETYSKIVSIATHLSSGQIKIYPNPFSDYLAIDLIGNSSNQNKKMDIIDVLGKIVWTGNLSNWGSNSQNIVFPTAALLRGMYWVKIEGCVVQKLVKL